MSLEETEPKADENVVNSDVDTAIEKPEEILADLLTEEGMTERKRNVFFEACDRIIKEVVNIKTSAQGLGEEFRLRSELNRSKQENEELKRKLRKYQLLVPMYKMEIKSLKNEMERERKRAMLMKSSSPTTSSKKREMMREKLALKIDMKRRRRSLSFNLRNPMLSPSSPASPTTSPNPFISPFGNKSNEAV